MPYYPGIHKDRSVRIAFYNLRAYPLFDPEDSSVFGGAEVQLFHLSTGLAAAGHEVRFLTRGPGPFAEREIRGVHVLKLAPGSKMRTLWDTGRFLLACRADIYVQRCAGWETALMAVLAKAARGRFCFMTASLLDCRDQLAQEGHSWMYRAYRRGVRHADCVICQNEEQQRLLLENFGIGSHVLRSACAPVDDSVEESLPREPGRILWVGRCDPYKDPISYIHLARALPEISFRMVMPPGDRPEYNRQIEEELRNVSNLDISQGSPFHKMEAEYRQAAILVNTSILEGFPNTFLEAMRAGVPILSYRLDPGGFLEVHQAGICVKGDFHNLVDRCRMWREVPEATIGYGDAGREYVRRMHDARIVAAEFERILTSLGRR